MRLLNTTFVAFLVFCIIIGLQSARGQGNDNSSLPAVTNMILFSKPVYITPRGLESAARSYGIKNVSVRALKRYQNTYLMHLDKVPFIIINVPHPVARNTFDAVLKFGFGLDNGQQIVSRQRAHIVVSPFVKSKNMRQSIPSAIGVAQVSAIISRLQTPLGHYWSHSDTLFSHTQFENSEKSIRNAIELQKVNRQDAGASLPFMMWVGMRLTGNMDGGKVGARTVGLTAFTGYELEISPMLSKPEVLGHKVYGAIEFLFKNGPVLKSGEALWLGNREYFRLDWRRGTQTSPSRFVLSLLKDKQ